MDFFKNKFSGAEVLQHYNTKLLKKTGYTKSLLKKVLSRSQRDLLKRDRVVQLFVRHIPKFGGQIFQTFDLLVIDGISLNLECSKLMEQRQNHAFLRKSEHFVG